MLFGERQCHPTIAGADEVGFLQIDGERAFYHLLDIGRRRFDRRFCFQQAPERAPKFFAQLARWRPVLNLYDRLVIDVEKQVIRKARLARDFFGMGMVARSCDIPEEIRFALGAGRIELGRLPAQPLEDFAERSLHAGPGLSKAFALNLADAGLLEIVELFEKLLETKGPLQRAEERIELDQSVGVGKRPPEQGELPVDMCLLTRHSRRSRVVRARIGDAVTDHIAVLAEEDSLGRCRAKIDADESFHASLLKPPRWRQPASDQSSGNNFRDGS